MIHFSIFNLFILLCGIALFLYGTAIALELRKAD